MLASIKFIYSSKPFDGQLTQPAHIGLQDVLRTSPINVP